MLSRYCAYLVAYEPGLLLDNRAWMEKAYNDITADLDGFFGSYCTTAHRRDRLMTTGFHRDGDVLSRESTVLEKGVMLAKELDCAAGNATAPNVRHNEAVWEVLLELWAELLVFAARAPSGKAEAHALALANGGEFITHIWAILIHAGVRPRRPSHHHDDPEYEDMAHSLSKRVNDLGLRFDVSGVYPHQQSRNKFYLFKSQVYLIYLGFNTKIFIFREKKKQTYILEIINGCTSSDKTRAGKTLLHIPNCSSYNN
ncbi:hypothetical protein EJB05_06308, partial [Eragrostis curvula]